MAETVDDAKHMTVVKIVSLDTESTVDSSSESKAKKRKLSVTTESEYDEEIRRSSCYNTDKRSSSETPVHGIPDKTSKWDDAILPLLRIGMVLETHHPYYVFTKPVLKPDGSSTDFEKYRPIFRMTCDTNSHSREHKIKFECVKYVFTNLLNFNYKHIQEVSQQNLSDIYVKVKNLQETDLLKGVPEINPQHYLKAYPSIKRSCMRIIVELGNFIQQLLLMIMRRNECPSDLTAGVYQELFVRFVKIFGLNIIAVPNVPTFKTSIGNVEVSSVPDALIIHPSCQNLILAAIEVKKEYSTEAEPELVRKLQRTEKTDKSVNHINSSLKGQHIGEMISVLKNSVFGEGGIYGFIVQGTEVTVTAMSAEKKYLEALQRGYLPISERNLASIKCSEKCNILKKKGRIELCQTLFDMAIFLENL